jgi:hypothetical protein
VICGKALRIEAIPISLLPHATRADIPAHQLPLDEAFIDIGSCVLATRGWERAGGFGGSPTNL